MSEIVRVPFHGDNVLTVLVGGKPHVILRPAVEALGLDYSAQLKRLKRQPWSTMGVTAMEGREYVTVDVRTFLMLLATVPVARVAESIRSKLVAYQREIADVIEQYWTRGRVVNPRILSEGFFEPRTLTWEEATALIRQRYGMALTVNELTGLLRTGGMLKQTGAPTKKYRDLFWFTGSCWNVHPHVLPEIAQKAYETGRQLQDFRFVQARLELDGLGWSLTQSDNH